MYHLLLMTEFVASDSIRYNTGWSLLVFTLLNIAVNMLIALRKNLIALWRFLKSFVLKIKVKILSQREKKKSIENKLKSTGKL